MLWPACNSAFVACHLRRILPADVGDDLGPLTSPSVTPAGGLGSRCLQTYPGTMLLCNGLHKARSLPSVSRAACWCMAVDSGDSSPCVFQRLRRRKHATGCAPPGSRSTPSCTRVGGPLRSPPWTALVLPAFGRPALLYLCLVCCFSVLFPPFCNDRDSHGCPLRRGVASQVPPSAPHSLLPTPSPPRRLPPCPAAGAFSAPPS